MEARTEMASLAFGQWRERPYEHGPGYCAYIVEHSLPSGKKAAHLHGMGHCIFFSADKPFQFIAELSPRST
jgi:hypothetical protein